MASREPVVVWTGRNFANGAQQLGKVYTARLPGTNQPTSRMIPVRRESYENSHAVFVPYRGSASQRSGRSPSVITFTQYN
jgi:hypothetical protein